MAILLISYCSVSSVYLLGSQMFIVVTSTTVQVRLWEVLLVSL